MSTWTRHLVVTCTAALAGAALVVAQGPAAPHDKAFWTDIAAKKYALPAGADVPALVRELSGHLGSPNPEWRDDIAYSTLVSWIYSQKVVAPELRRELLAGWQRNLSVNVGEAGTDTVFLRSFSVLSLGILAILDNEAAYLDRAEFDALLDSAITYLREEKDVRGFDAAKGWMHSVAHTADLIKFLARSRHLRPEQQARILTAITDKLGRVDTPLTHGEDERLARAVLSIAARPDFDDAAFKTWASSIGPVRPTGPPTPASLAAGQNRKSFAAALFAVLSTDARGLATVASARAHVLAALKTFM